MNTYFIFGLVVMVFVLVIPQGIVPTLRDWRDHLGRYRRQIGGALGMVGAVGHARSARHERSEPRS
jgi:hypothetical protein